VLVFLEGHNVLPEKTCGEGGANRRYGFMKKKKGKGEKKVSFIKGGGKQVKLGGNRTPTVQARKGGGAKYPN